MMTAEATPTTSKNWERILNEADLPANELINLLVEVYAVPQDEAGNIVRNWMYSDAT